MFGLFAVARKNSYPSAGLTVVSKANNLRSPNGPNWLVLLILLLGVVAMGIFMSKKELPPGLITTPDGEISLSPERQAKLDGELEEIDNAVQYALVVTVDGLYPCYSCTNGQKTIFLNFGEVWKYGVTRKGQEGRYPNGNYGAPNLLFVRQVIGTYSECLKAEKTMIYSYPLLPQTQARDFILIRPPGNKYDS
jgi:hypothetical protein